MSDVGEVTDRVKDSPIMKIFPSKDKTTSAPAETTTPAQKEKASRSR